jgi:O-antigen/teichoic acid export membrane protein
MEAPTMSAAHARSLMTRSGQVAIGVVTAGAGTFIMLAVVARLTEPDRFSVVAAWWIAATLLVFPLGVFEVLLTRLVVSDVAAKRPTSRSVGAVVARAGAWVALVAAALAIADSAVSGWLFRGNRGTSALLGVFLLVGACQTLQRGLSAGRGSFAVVALQLSSDGVLRATFASGAAALFPTSPSAIVGAICLGSAGSVLITHAKARGWLAPPRLHDSRISNRLSVLLLVGSAGPILINNASVPWLSASGSGALTVGAFSAALTLSRVPIQLSSAVFGPLLNRMAHAIETDDLAGSHELNRRAVQLATLVAGVFAAGFTGLGGLGLSWLIGAAYRLPWWTFGGLGCSSALMLVAVVVQARAAAEQRWAGIAGCWIAAAIGFAACFTGPGGSLQRASAAPLIGSGIALIGLVAITRTRRSATDSAR